MTRGENYKTNLLDFEVTSDVNKVMVTFEKETRVPLCDKCQPVVFKRNLEVNHLFQIGKGAQKKQEKWSGVGSPREATGWGRGGTDVASPDHWEDYGGSLSLQVPLEKNWLAIITYRHPCLHLRM